MDKKDTVCAVVVTYNRKRLLLECLEALFEQTRQLDAIYLVDNASSDGTVEFLANKGYIEAMPGILSVPMESEKLIGSTKIHYVRMPENTGGSGGFYEGIKRGYEKGYDWLWVMDDDVLPEVDCLKELMSVWRVIAKKEGTQPSALACARFYEDGMLAADEAKRLNLTNPFKSLHQKRISVDDLRSAYIVAEGVTFEGLLVSAPAIAVAGLPNAAFFIYGDDTEYCIRLLSFGAIYYVPTAKMIKMIFTESLSGLKYSWKKYYMLRNLIFIDLKYAKLLVRIVRVPYQLIKSIIGRVFYGHFSDIPMIVRSFFDARDITKM